MNNDSFGRTVLFTGPVTPLTAAVARQLGRQGSHLAFAGPAARSAPELRQLAYEFGGRLAYVDVDTTSADEIERAAEKVGRRFSGLDLFVHTLGGGLVDCFDAFATSPAASSGLVQRSAPLTGAVTCSRGAARYARAHGRGQIVHLITRADVGSVEVERRVIATLQASWVQDRAQATIPVSMIYFQEAGPLALPASQMPGCRDVGEVRLLEAFGARLLEEDDWIARVIMERQIGDLVQRVCSRPDRTETPIRSYEFPGITSVRPTVH